MFLCFCAMTPDTFRRAPTTAVPINGAALREIRIRTGIGVAELAKEIGVGRPYITKIELGHSKRVSPEVFRALMAALDIRDQRVLRSQDVA